jgi:hypothetical protein
VDVSNFNSIEVFADAPDSQLKCGSDSLPRRSADAASPCFIGYADEMPSASSNPPFHLAHASRQSDVPAFHEFAGCDEAWG